MISYYTTILLLWSNSSWARNIFKIESKEKGIQNTWTQKWFHPYSDANPFEPKCYWIWPNSKDENYNRGKNKLSIRFGIIPMLSIELEVKYFIRFTKTFRKCKKGSSWENVHHHLVHGKYHCQSIHIFVYKKYWKLILMNSVHSPHYIIFFLPFIHCTLEMASMKQMCVSIFEFSIMKSLWNF